MKSQSDYDTETDALLRQADDCMEEWWEGDEPSKFEESTRTAKEEEESILIVKREVRKRGLSEVGENARL